MIEIVIRHIDSTVDISMGKFEPHEVSDIVECVKKFGCFIDDDDARFYSARFIALPEDNKTYFEIVIENG